MNYRREFGASALVFALASMAFGQIYSNRSTDVRAPALNAATVSKSGVASPAGGYWSEVQNDTGNLLESNTSAGASGHMTGTTGAFRLADDFDVVNGGAVINQIRVFGYQTGLAAATPLATSISMRIWSGRPGDSGSTMLFDYPTCPFTESNSFVVAASGPSTLSGNLYRVFNTTTPAPGTVPGTTRLVRAFTCTLPSPATLPAGNYWFDWQVVTTAGTLICFMPNTTHDGFRTPQNPAGPGNSRQFVTTPAWTDLIDAGNPAAAPDIQQDMPFMLTGNLVRFADSYAVTGGLGFGGTIDSLDISDNDRAIILCDELNPNGQFGAVFNTKMLFNGTNYLGDIQVQLESRSTRNDQNEFVHMFNTVTNSFDLVMSHSTTFVDTSYTTTIVNAGNYVGPARNVGLRVTVIPSFDIDAGDGWTDSFDMLRIVVGS